LRNGETIDWEGYSLTVDWMPGQTKYHACLHGAIDGRRVAFTVDNIFASTTDPRQGGNECVLARNGGTLEEGYLYAAEYLHTINPDLIIGGHCWLLDRPEQLIERFRTRMRALREAFQDLPPSGQRLLHLLFEDPPLPYAEISARLGIPVGSIGPTRRRCLDKLRRHPAIAALINAGTTSPDEMHDPAASRP